MKAPVPEREAIDEISTTAKKSALRDVALLPLGMLAAYLLMAFVFRRRGGYAPVSLTPPTGKS